EEAIASYDRALELKPNDHAIWSNRSLVLYVIGHHAEAIASYDKVLELKPDDFYAWTGKGNAQKELGQYDTAIASYNRALAIQPTYSEALTHRDTLLNSINHPSTTATETEQAAPVTPSKETPISEDGNHKDWFWRGNELYALGRYKDAIESYEKATQYKPNYHEAWYNRGIALSNLGQIEAAIASYDKALEIKPDKHQAWYSRGISLSDLGQIEAAIASYDKTLEFKPDHPEARTKRGTLLINLDLQTAKPPVSGATDPTPEEQADPTPEEQPAPIHPGVVFPSEAIFLKKDAFDPPTELDDDPYPFDEIDGIDGIDEIHENPSYGDANSEGTTDRGLAIAIEDIAIEVEPSPPTIWDDFGETLPADRASAIASHPIVIPQDEPWTVWDYRGLTALYEQKYKAALTLWDKGIEALESQNKDPYGRGKLYYRKGQTQYYEGRRQPNPFPEWVMARNSYLKALEYITQDRFPEEYLEILQAFLRVCYHLDGPFASQQILEQGTEILANLLQNPSLTQTQKIALEAKFAGFKQLQVDRVVQQDPIQALELAEAYKNRRLGRLRKGWNHQPTYAQVQTLLTPNSAIIYWHLSPVALTTFVLKHNQPPQILQSTLQLLDQVQNPELRDYPAPTYQLRRLEEWIRQWKQNYQQYQDFESENAQFLPWRKNMEPMLYIQLRKILEINRLGQEYLQDVDRLILIPHRELHLLPLHAVFPARFDISYLPSAQFGLDLQYDRPLPPQRLLSVEGPRVSEKDPHIFSALESAAIATLYGKVRSLTLGEEEATKNKVMSAIKMMSGCFHFCGQGSYPPSEQSGLALAHQTELTLIDLLELDCSRYGLVCLSACEADIARVQPPIDEYVGLVSGFLSAGATHVINALWPVDDVAGTLLMIQFHRFLKNPLSPAQALREAQAWLSTVTHSELADWYRELATQLAIADPSSSHVEKLRHLAQFATHESDPDDTPYAHPYFWAGFTITGKVPQQESPI
ncbi:MAG: CHAT domain-containing protein, partial [Acaryochloridaceae cyanobacterium RU_4_10]|nr:CHAT domain-containing protein [Acaryochloridaceae cyanobacterium RU_4_10]